MNEPRFREITGLLPTIVIIDIQSLPWSRTLEVAPKNVYLHQLLEEDLDDADRSKDVNNPGAHLPIGGGLTHIHNPKLFHSYVVGKLLVAPFIGPKL